MKAEKKRDPHTFTPEQATSLRAHMKDQIKIQTDACLAVAKALFEVYYGTLRTTDAPLVTGWGFATFEDYVEKELLWHGGTARSYIRVFDELCVRRQFDEGTLPPSITALRELAKVSRKLTDQRELARWIKRSHELTACDFKAEVEVELYGRSRRKRTIGFAMQWGAAGRCMKRIHEIRESLGLSTTGEALERIVMGASTGRMTTSEARRLRKVS